MRKLHYECQIHIDRQGGISRTYAVLDDALSWRRITDRAYYKARKLGKRCRIVVHVDPVLDGLDIDTEEETTCT